MLSTDRPTDGHTLLKSYGPRSKAKPYTWHKSFAALVSVRRKKEVTDLPIDRPTDRPTDITANFPVPCIYVTAIPNAANCRKPNLKLR